MSESNAFFISLSLSLTHTHTLPLSPSLCASQLMRMTSDVSLPIRIYYLLCGIRGQLKNYHTQISCIFKNEYRQNAPRHQFGSTCHTLALQRYMFAFKRTIEKHGRFYRPNSTPLFLCLAHNLSHATAARVFIGVINEMVFVYCQARLSRSGTQRHVLHMLMYTSFK